MLDILLIQPPIRDFYLTTKRTIPYGLARIAGKLIQDGFSVQIIDGLATARSRICRLPEEMSYLRPYYDRYDHSPFALFHHYKHFGYSFAHIGKQAQRFQPFLVGISSLFSAYADEAIKTAEAVKADCPNCKIVLGGHHPTALPERVMESSAVDFVLRGEAEVTISLLAKAIRDGLAYDEIAGLVFRKPDGRLHVGQTVIMHRPDDYPLPAISLINHRYYRRKKKPGVVIVASRGCPMKCTYCAVGAASSLTYRRRSVAAVIDEIENAVSRYDAGFIDFEDENLALDRHWFLALLNEIRQRFDGKQLELRAMNGLYPPALNAPVICAMQAAGFKILNLSLGTTATAQLKRFQRPDVRTAFEQALNLAQTHRLKAVGYIIIGAPFQKATDSVNDLLFLAQQRVLAGSSVFYPAPGSNDYALCAAMGLLPKNFSCMRSSALPLSHTTTRQESITLLRLSRIVNFMKHLIDCGEPIPDASPAVDHIENPSNRQAAGKQLLQFFLDDGKIRGVTRRGDVFEHEISVELSRKFLTGLRSIRVRGCQV